jgi:hypothetical protein
MADFLYLKILPQCKVCPIWQYISASLQQLRGQPRLLRTYCEPAANTQLPANMFLRICRKFAASRDYLRTCWPLLPRTFQLLQTCGKPAASLPQLLQFSKGGLINCRKLIDNFVNIVRIVKIWSGFKHLKPIYTSTADREQVEWRIYCEMGFCYGWGLTVKTMEKESGVSVIDRDNKCPSPIAKAIYA